jgi:hypothetical protein
VAFGVETIGNFASAIFTVLIAGLTVDAPALDPYRWALGAALVALLIAIHPKIIGWMVAIAARVLRRRPFEVTFTYPQLLRYLGLYVINWLLFGVALYVFIRSFYPLDVSSILFLTGAFSFAGMMGIVAVFAPAGLGVREGILALFLGQVMPVPVALVVSVASRVWLTIVELGSVGLVYLMIRFRWIDADEPSTSHSGGLGARLDDGVEGGAQ